MKFSPTRYLAGTVAILGALGLASPVMASFGNALAPGGTATPAVLTFPATSSTLVASKSITINGNPNVTGTLTQSVYRESGSGTLDFFYQLTNTSPAAGGLNAYFSSFNVTNFGTATPFATSVGYFTNTFDNFTTGTFAPIQFQRSNDGGTITFGFDTVGNASPGLPLGTTTFVMFISTNATNFDAFGTGNAISESGGNINLGSDAVNGLFEPTNAAVPEPSSIVLCGLAGLIGLGVRQYRRTR